MTTIESTAWELIREIERAKIEKYLYLPEHVKLLKLKDHLRDALEGKGEMKMKNPVNSGLTPDEVVRLRTKLEQLAGLCSRESLSFTDRNPYYSSLFVHAGRYLTHAAGELELIINDPDDGRDRGAY